MKKLLSILSAIGLTATASSAVVACGTTHKDKSIKEEMNITSADFDDPNALSANIDKKVNEATGYWHEDNDLGAQMVSLDTGQIGAHAELYAREVLVAVYKNGDNYAIAPVDLLSKDETSVLKVRLVAMKYFKLAHPEWQYMSYNETDGLKIKSTMLNPEFPSGKNEDLKNAFANGEKQVEITFNINK